ncbi:carbohydrate ABC transporter membrane protein 1, CUT1 family (TC 3.A.1.1.-) [Proteiniborus ethanoligenes]|uniref:Carbohydrate ABC transporter membrane protein 1, CUT1 family (TC 3.A.1.1.-) n=1 Tax=Proteiniborus ethanoligenes TaxID=415015 RepID=A0A1H3P982_9FIRM|nr:sugar ABC transporter permease [Proteiniborus ethanoligenes]TAH63985.1 MAG: sugar ABC transporter permease [Gottschalkiaceae bacterium]SDY97647.1 carbohydrate ABC transporter membrane protein 1, CUT1 family (TC 3.A.1.1.-) [Proteiniborus ethanoligenes]
MLSRFSIKDKFIAVLFIAPSVIGISVFYIIPFIWMVIYSFFDKPVNGSFVGFKNYIDLINNGIYRKALSNTAIFTGISVPLIIILSLILAILLNQKIHFKHTLRTSFIVPLVVPVASVILFFEYIFDYHGLVNKIFSMLNINATDWLNSPHAMLVVIIIYVWKNLGYNMILFLAGLQGIPKEYYEAADIDGAGALTKFFNITSIYLMPTTFFVIIISIISSFKVFKEVYLLSGSYPHESIYMLQHYLNNMFSKLDYHKLVTSAVLMAVVLYLIIFILFKIQKKVERYIEG